MIDPKTPVVISVLTTHENFEAVQRAVWGIDGKIIQHGLLVTPETLADLKKISKLGEMSWRKLAEKASSHSVTESVTVSAHGRSAGNRVPETEEDQGS